MFRRRRKREGEHMDESWLIPYSDMLTLLLALFVVLFAASSVDAEKYQNLMITLNEHFQGATGVLEENVPPTQTTPPATEEGEEEKSSSAEQEREDLKRLQEKIDEYIDENHLSSNFETTLTQGGLLLTILDNALFYSGSAEVRTEAIELAVQLSELLVTDPPRSIVVTGHTDSVPIHNAQFRSNWDLSAMRALNFMKILLENDKLDPANFTVTGHGEYQPVATNDTEEGREKNRRVEVLILPNY